MPGPAATRRSSALGRPALAVALGALVGALALVGCSPGHLPKAPPPPTTSKTPRTTTSSSAAAATATTTTSAPASVTAPAQGVAYDTNAGASVAVGAQPANWDIHSAAAAAWGVTLQQILAQVWPSAFYASPSGAPQLNQALVNSATEVSTSPQVVVYQLNPKAVWSNGAPITYRDFVYNWEAQSGQARFHDTGGLAFTPASAQGYDDISSVTGSPSDPYTVTVKFSSGYADWRSLFSYLVPAQVAEHVGFDTGFTDPVADLVSGGPFMVAEAQDGYSLELVRNARYWGAPANLASVTYYFTSGTDQVLASLATAGVDLATVPASEPGYKQLQGLSGLSVTPEASNLYEDLDFNEADHLLAQPVLRQAIMMATERGTMAADVLAPYGLPATPVENRFFLPGSAGYVDDGGAYDKADSATAGHLLAQAGYTMVGDVLRTPAGKAVDLSLAVAADDAVADQLAQSVASSCASLGISVTVAQYGPGQGDVLEPQSMPELPAGWQMAIELRPVPAYPSYGLSRYSPGSPPDVDGYASTSMQALVDLVPKTPAAALPVLYDQVDTRAWKDFVDLPLVQLPVLVVRAAKLLNVTAGPYFSLVAFDEQDWGFPS